LTVKHFSLQILSKVASCGKTWKEAFLSTLPARKGAKEIGDDDEEDEDEDEDDEDSSPENEDQGSEKLEQTTEDNQSTLD
jgi:hypothetical protein